MALVNKAFSDIITFTRASGGGIFNALGNFEWLPANTPRIDYDPVTGECRGLLVEEQRVNLLTYSSEFGNAVWNKRGTCVVTVNSLSAPDGTMSGDLIEGLDSGLNDMYRQNIPGLAAEGRYEPSVFVKKVTASGLVRLSNAYTPAYGDWEIDLSKLGAGWERITRSHPSVTVLAEFKSHTTGYCGFQFRKTTAGPVSFGVWQADIQPGSFPTSPIPTTTAQVTRAADIANVNTLSPWYRADEGTLFVEASQPTIFASSRSVISLNDGLNSNRLTLYRQSAGPINVFVNPGTTGITVGASATAGVPWKHAAAYSGSTVFYSANGSETKATATQLAGGTLKNLTIGNAYPGGPEFLNGHIKQLRFYPRRLSNSEIQALTG